MLFSFSGLATLGASEFDGGIGAKYYLLDQLALRIGLPFAYANQSIPANAPAGSTGTDGSTSAVRFGLSAAAEYHLLKTRVSPYVGGGLGFTNTSTKSKTAVVAPLTQSTTDNRAAGETIGGNGFAAGTAFDVGGIAGVEFFIVKELSLSAEYQLGYLMNARSDQKVTTVVGTTTTTTTTQEGTLSQFGISAAGVLTLSVYF
jgi:opacity protein-like surface antigen